MRRRGAGRANSAGNECVENSIGIFVLRDSSHPETLDADAQMRDHRAVIRGVIVVSQRLDVGCLYS